MGSLLPGDSLEEFICQICLELLIESPDDVSEPVAGSSRPTKLPRLVPVPELQSTSCGHVFHKICISKSFKRKNKCPSCRENISQQSLRRIYLPLNSEGQCRKCKGRIEEVEVMGKIQNDMVGTQNELQGKLENMHKEAEKINRKLDETEKQVEELKRKLEEKDKCVVEITERHKKEVEKLETKVMVMNGVQKRLEREVEEKGRENEKFKEEVEETQMTRDVELSQHKWELTKINFNFEKAKNEFQKDMEKKLEELKNEFGKEMAETMKTTGNEINLRDAKIENVMKSKFEAEEKSKFIKKSLEDLKEENGRLKEDKEILLKREKERTNEVRRKKKDWEQMYKLCLMEKDKEKELTAFYEKWCKRLSGINEDDLCDILTLTEAMETKLPEADNTFTASRTEVFSSHHNPSVHMTNALPEMDDNQEGPNHDSLSTTGFTLERITAVEHDLFLSSEDEDSTDSDDTTSSGLSLSDENAD